MSQYIDRNEAQKSYRPVAGSMSPGLRRAREPYRLKNALVGLSLGAFAIGVWAYSISAVKQDIFDDVDEEVKELASPSTATTAAILHPTPPPPPTGTGAAILAGTSVTTPANEATLAPSVGVVIPKDVPAVEEKPSTRPARGILQHLGPRLPWLLDPAGKTLVWGAPPVDDMGKMWGKRS